jgi:hypothetical protein
MKFKMNIPHTQERILSFLPPDQGRLERVSRVFRDEHLRRREELMIAFEQDRQNMGPKELIERYWMYREVYHILVQIDTEALFYTALGNGVFLEKLYTNQYLERMLINIGCNGDLSLLKYFVSRYELSVEQLNTVMLCAPKHGHLDMFKWVILRGADTDLALESAARRGNKEMVTFALLHGANIPKNLSRRINNGRYPGILNFVHTEYERIKSGN